MKFSLSITSFLLLLCCGNSAVVADDNNQWSAFELISVGPNLVLAAANSITEGVGEFFSATSQAARSAKLPVNWRHLIRGSEAGILLRGGSGSSTLFLGPLASSISSSSGTPASQQRLVPSLLRIPLVTSSTLLRGSPLLGGQSAALPHTAEESGGSTVILLTPEDAQKMLLAK